MKKKKKKKRNHKKDPNALKYPATEKGEKIEIDLSGAIIVTDLMKNGNVSSLVTEYLESKGQKNEKLNPTIRSKIIYGVSAIMKKVHNKNIIHFDLHLGNIFLDENLEPKIANFGITKVFMNDYVPLEVTPYIMTPEIFMDEDEKVGISVDVYSFAFLIYKMFSKSDFFIF